MTVATALLVPLVLLVLADSPAAVGTTPYGAVARGTGGAGALVPARRSPGDGRGGRLAGAAGGADAGESSRSRVFWILVGTFWICGWSTNGLIGPTSSRPPTTTGCRRATAAGLLALIGVFDIVGTVGSGWLTDRMDPRLLLFVYYWFRGMSLLVVPWLLGPVVAPPLWVFIVFYGLDWVATVPPTVALCRTHFGLERSGVVFGWVFASHMVGRRASRRASPAGSASPAATTSVPG